MKQSFDELREREERKNNLVIFNLKESTKDDINEALSEDLEQLKIVLNITNPEMTNNITKELNTSNITRLGRKPQNKDNQTKPRPLKVSLPNESAKFKIIRNSYKLKSCQSHPKIGLKFD